MRSYVQQVGSVSAAASTTGSVTLPVAPTVGSLLVFAMAGDKNTGTVTLPGFISVYSMPSTSISLYMFYKVADGSERTVTPIWSLPSAAGNTLWYAEYDDPAVAGNSWGIAAQASRITTEGTTTTWSTGTTTAATDAGCAIAAAAIDDSASTSAGLTWDAYPDVYADLYQQFVPRFTNIGTGNQSALFVADADITAGSSAGVGFEWGTADQASGSVVVFWKVSGYAADAASLPVTATHTAGGVTAKGSASTVAAVVGTRPAGGFANLPQPSTVVAVTAARAAAGARRVSSTGIPTGVTATRTAGGTVSGGDGDTTPVAVTVEPTTEGAAGKTGAAPRGITATNTGTGAAGKPNAATTLTATATRVAAGGLTIIGGAARTVTATTTGVLRRGGTGAATLLVTGNRPVVGLTQYGYGAHRPVTARLVASGTSQSIPTSYMADILYQGLPAVYRAVDAEPAQANRRLLLYRYIHAVLAGLHTSEVIAERIMGGELTDSVTADDAWIPWLAQVMGVDGADVVEMRARIQALSVAPSIGSATYLIALTKSLLTDTQSMEYIPQPPWAILVRVKASELGLVGGTTDGLRDAIMATGRVPTGFTLIVSTTAATWGEVDSVSAMWSDQPAGKPWSEVDTSGI